MNVSSLVIRDLNFWKRINKVLRISFGYECIYSFGVGWYSNYFWKFWWCLSK